MKGLSSGEPGRKPAHVSLTVRPASEGSAARAARSRACCQTAVVAGHQIGAGHPKDAPHESARRGEGKHLTLDRPHRNARLCGYAGQFAGPGTRGVDDGARGAETLGRPHAQSAPGIGLERHGSGSRINRDAQRGAGRFERASEPAIVDLTLALGRDAAFARPKCRLGVADFRARQPACGHALACEFRSVPS
jgi:hypothetical protein